MESPNFATVRVKTLTDIEQRGSDDNPFYLTYVIENITGTTKTMTFPRKFQPDFQRGRFYCVRHVTISDIIRLNVKSSVSVKLYS